MAYATVDELAAALRITANAGNTLALQRCLDAAAGEIDHATRRGELQALPTAGYFFDAGIASGDPGIGYLRLDRTNPAAVKALYVDVIDADGVDRSPGITGLRPDDSIQIADAAGGWSRFTLTAIPVDQVGWLELAVERTDAGDPLELEQDALLTVQALTPEPLQIREFAIANRVNILRGVEWWKANDAAFGVIGFDQTGALRTPRDGFARHRSALVPLKQSWGVA